MSNTILRHGGFVIYVSERTAGYLQLMGGPNIASNPNVKVYNWSVRVALGMFAPLVGFGWSPTFEIAVRCGQETAEGCPTDSEREEEPIEYKHPGWTRAFDGEAPTHKAGCESFEQGVKCTCGAE